LLQKKLFDTGSANNQTIWSLKGNQGTQWFQGQAPIPRLGKSFKIVFEGVRGKTFKGDIAIDDISFTSSTCGGTQLSFYLN
jgi:hypothetical protein